jgi:hypothetical protein
MKLMASALLVWLASANTPEADAIDTPLEWYFGALAVTALVMTWAWLYLKSRERMKVRESIDAMKEAASKEAEDDAVTAKEESK